MHTYIHAHVYPKKVANSMQYPAPDIKIFIVVKYTYESYFGHI